MSGATGVLVGRALADAGVPMPYLWLGLTTALVIAVVVAAVRSR